MKLIYGVGYNDKTRPVQTDKIPIKAYSKWSRMLRRCYSNSYLEESPSYIACEVGENFKNYSYFHDWYNTQIGASNTEWHLDKDILIKGNKLYSEDTCVIVPQEINKLMTKNAGRKRDLPIGVCYHISEKRYYATCNRGKDELAYIGRFLCPIEAFYAYKKVKEDFIKQQAEKYKDRIDPRAYEALMNYEVEITD